jgi:hypothetical protein
MLLSRLSGLFRGCRDQKEFLFNIGTGGTSVEISEKEKAYDKRTKRSVTSDTTPRGAKH